MDRNDANFLLDKIGLTIGEWNRVVYLNHSRDRHQICYQAPRDALSMYCFSLHVAGWLPKGEWQMFQIDDATVLAQDEAVFVSRLIGAQEPIGVGERRALLFESGDADWLKSNLTISYLIYAFLLFEGHGYLVSSGSQGGEMICIQDGFVYFISEKEGIPDAQALVNLFENNQRKSPSWMFARQTGTDSD